MNSRFIPAVDVDVASWGQRLHDAKLTTFAKIQKVVKQLEARKYLDQYTYVDITKQIPGADQLTLYRAIHIATELKDNDIGFFWNQGMGFWFDSDANATIFMLRMRTDYDNP